MPNSTNQVSTKNLELLNSHTREFKNVLYPKALFMSGVSCIFTQHTKDLLKEGQMAQRCSYRLMGNFDCVAFSAAFNSRQC
jgi:hypothetical protein